MPKFKPLITLLTELTVPIKPQKVPKSPKKISKPIKYLAISLFSSSLPATPSKTERKAAADIEKFFKLVSSPSIRSSGAIRTGFERDLF